MCPRTWKWRQEGCKFEPNLSYIMKPILGVVGNLCEERET